MGLGEGVTLADVAAGKQDTAIKKWAQEAKAFGHPFLFAPWWEMNGGWYAWGRSPDFIAAWRHFHDVVAGQGATNVTWTWVVNSIWYDPASDPSPYYPGDAYVDWTGLDTYNWGRNPAQPDKWINPEQTVTPTLKIIREVAPTKPLALVETASSEYGGNKTDWVREMLTTYLPHHPEIGAFLWFNWNFKKGEKRADWPIESSAPAQQEFRKGIQSSLFVPGPVSLPALTKVPPPSGGSNDATLPADLTPAAEMAAGPDVDVGADGTATVVWSARSGGEFGVFARQIEADGTRSATQQLSAAGGDALTPRVAVAPDGTAFVAWIRWDGANFRVQERRIAAGGALEEAPRTLSGSGQNAIEPQVDVAPDGEATVVWKRFDGFHYLAQVRRIAPDGSSDAASQRLSESGQDAVEPAVAVADDGTATVVWSRFDGSDSIVQARRVGPDGTLAATTANLSAVGESAIQPRVGIGPGGEATVVWNRFDGANWIIQGQRLGTGGAPAGGVLNLSATTRSAAEPQLAVGANGVATAVWGRWDGGSFVVQARRLDAGGNLLAGPVQLSAGGRDAADPRVAAGPGGGATVLWSRFDGSNWIVQRRDLDGAGALAATVTLSAAGRGAGDPSLARGNDGTLAMVSAALGRARRGRAGEQPPASTTPSAPAPSTSAATTDGPDGSDGSEARPAERRQRERPAGRDRHPARQLVPDQRHPPRPHAGDRQAGDRGPRARGGGPRRRRVPAASGRGRRQGDAAGHSQAAGAPSPEPRRQRAAEADRHLHPQWRAAEQPRPQSATEEGTARVEGQHGSGGFRQGNRRVLVRAAVVAVRAGRRQRVDVLRRDDQRRNLRPDRQRAQQPAGLGPVRAPRRQEGRDRQPGDAVDHVRQVRGGSDPRPRLDSAGDDGAGQGNDSRRHRQRQPGRGDQEMGAGSQGVGIPVPLRPLVGDERSLVRLGPESLLRQRLAAIPRPRRRPGRDQRHLDLGRQQHLVRPRIQPDQVLPRRCLRRLGRARFIQLGPHARPAGQVDHPRADDHADPEDHQGGGADEAADHRRGRLHRVRRQQDRLDPGNADHLPAAPPRDQGLPLVQLELARRTGLREDWPIESSAPAQQQFRKAIQSGLFVPRPVSMPALTKVKAPAATSGEAVQAADLSPAAEMATGPDVGVARDGASTVVWSARSGSGAFTVFTRRIAPNGTLGTIRQLSASGQDALAPQVAVTSGGMAVVTWVRSDGTNFVVQARRITAAGTPEESTKTLSGTGQDAAAPQVAVAPDGTATVAWKRFDGAHYYVQERQISATGTVESSAHILSATGQDAVEPQVAVAGDGVATVVRSRYDGSDGIVQGRQIVPGGAPKAATLILSSSGESALQPQLAVGPGGVLTVVWSRFNGANWIIQERRLTAAGSAIGGVNNLSATGRNAAEPRVAVASDGRATVGLGIASTAAASSSSRAASIRPAPPARSSSTTRLPGATRPIRQIAISPGGVATVLWSRFDGSNWIVQRRDLLANGTLAGTQNLSVGGRTAGDPALAWGPRRNPGDDLAALQRCRRRRPANDRPPALSGRDLSLRLRKTPRGLLPAARRGRASGSARSACSGCRSARAAARRRPRFRRDRRPASRTGSAAWNRSRGSRAGPGRAGWLRSVAAEVGGDRFGGRVGLLGGDAALLDREVGDVADGEGVGEAADPRVVVDRDEALGVVGERRQVAALQRRQADHGVGFEWFSPGTIPSGRAVLEGPGGWAMATSTPWSASRSATCSEARRPKIFRGPSSGVTTVTRVPVIPCRFSSPAARRASS